MLFVKPLHKKSMATSQRQPQGIQSLEIGVSVLRVVQLAEQPLALKDIARESGLSASQAHRYLTSWLRTGFVMQDPLGGNYRLGDQALALGLAALHRHDTVERAAVQLTELVRLLGETGVMTIWCKDGPICIRWIRGVSLLGTDAGLGTIFPVAGSAAGLVFAAYLSPSLTLPLLLKQASLHEVKKKTGQGSAEAVRQQNRFLEVNRESVCKAGYAQARGHFVSGLSAVAAPVFDPQGEIVATVGVIVREANFAKSERRYADALIQATRKASLR